MKEIVTDREVNLQYRVHESLKQCAAARNTEEARDVLTSLFDSSSSDERDMLRYMLIEACVCLFHGMSSTYSHEMIMKATSPSPSRVQESKLGREPFSSLEVSKVDKDFEYDKYSDDSHGDTSYSDSDFGSHDDHGISNNNEDDDQIEKGKAKWAAVLSDDINRQQLLHGNDRNDQAFSSGSPSGKRSANDSPLNSNSNTVTCEDLFQALVTNASSVILPKVPSLSMMVEKEDGDVSSSFRESDHVKNDYDEHSNGDSTSLAETISESSSIPSHLPTSTVQSNGNKEEDDGFALSSVCSEDHRTREQLSTMVDDIYYHNMGKDDDSDDTPDNQDAYSDSPPHYKSPSKDINNLLSDNSEIEIDLDCEVKSSPSRTPHSPENLRSHHQYQEEQRYLFEQGQIIDSGFEDEDEQGDHDVGDDEKYECDRGFMGDERNISGMSDQSRSSTTSNYDTFLRKLLQATIVDVIVEAGMEMLPTPEKNKLSRHSSDKSTHSRDFDNLIDDADDKVLFTEPVLKKMCRAVAIELSIELRSPSCQLDTDHLIDDVGTMSSSSGGLRTETSFSSTKSQSSQESSLSPSARDIEQIIWPVFASFLNAEESNDMVVLMVDSLASLIVENTLHPLYMSIPRIEGVRTMSEEFENEDKDLHNDSSRYGNIASDELAYQTNLTSLAEVRSAPLVRRPSPPHSKQFLRPMNSSDFSEKVDQESVPPRSGSQTSLVNQYIDEIRHREAEHLQSTETTPEHRPPPRPNASTAAIIDPHENSNEYDVINGDLYGDVKGDDYNTFEDKHDQEPTAPWNIPKSPMDDVFRRTHNVLGSPYKFPSSTEHHEDDEFYDEEDYAHNLYGSGGIVQSPTRHDHSHFQSHTPSGQSITTTDACATQSILSHGISSASSSGSSVSSPLTHDNYNPPSRKSKEPLALGEESNSVDEEFSTNSLSMRSVNGDYDADQRGMSVNSLSSPSMSTRRSDTITVSDLPDNFGADFFGTDNSVEHLSEDEDNNDTCNNRIQFPGSDGAPAVRTQYTPYEMSMFDHLEKISHSPPSGGKRLAHSNSSASENSPSLEELEESDNLIILPKGRSPIGEGNVMFDGSDLEVESSTMEESDTSTDEDSDGVVEDGSQQRSLQTDAAVVCMNDEQEFEDHEHSLYGQDSSSNDIRKSVHDNFGDQIPLPGESYESHLLRVHMSPSELRESRERDPQMQTHVAPHSMNCPHETIIASGFIQSSSSSSPQSIYSSRLAQNIPLTSFTDILFNNAKTASQSYSDNSQESDQDNKRDGTDSLQRDENLEDIGLHDIVFSESTVRKNYSDRNDNRSLLPDEEAEEDIRLFNEIVASMEGIDPGDETARHNALYMTDLMKSSFDDNALSYLNDSQRHIAQNSDENNDNPFFDGSRFLNMEAVGDRLRNIVNSFPTKGKDEYNLGSTNGLNIEDISGPTFDSDGFQVSSDALPPSQYYLNHYSRSNNSGDEKSRNIHKTVSGDILMHEAGTRKSKHGQREDSAEFHSDFETSSSGIRADAMRSFGDMVQRYAAPMDLSPRKSNKKFVDADDFSDSIVRVDHDYISKRPSTAKSLPKMSLGETSPSVSYLNSSPPQSRGKSPERSSSRTSKRKGSSSDNGDVSALSSTSPSRVASSKQVTKKRSSPSVDEVAKKKNNAVSNKAAMKKTSSGSGPVSHIVVIPPVPLQSGSEDSMDIYSGSRDIYVDNKEGHGVDFTTANKSKSVVQKGGNNPPAFSPTSPVKAANAIAGRSTQISRSQQFNSTFSQKNNGNVGGQRPRPKSAPRLRSSSKTFTPNSATAALSAQRAAKDPSSLLRKSTSSIPSSSGKRPQGRSARASKRGGNSAAASRSVDDTLIKYSSSKESDIGSSSLSRSHNQASTRMSSRRQAQNLRNISAPTFSSAVRTLDIAGVDIATVQQMVAAPVSNVSQLSISGSKKNTKMKKQ